MMTGTRLRLGLLATCVATVVCDRITKRLATAVLEGTPARSFLADTVRIVYVENTGAFLSLGSRLPENLRSALFIGLNGIVLLVVAIVAIRQRWSGWLGYGAALLVAGGLSNWIDRAMSGYVVDFMNVGIGSLRTGVFNVADMAIMAGVAMLVVGELHRGKAAPLSS
ncbi:MAG: signal peptidase II [Thermoanaerobaculia bacterium]